MLAYTVSSRQLAETDIYEIKDISSLAEFLKPETSLCIIKTPYTGNIPEMMRIEGKNRYGEPMSIYLGSRSNDPGYLKCKLDKSLHSPFLFISWKQKGDHSFKLVKKQQTLAEFSDFQSALEAYFPDGFIPEKSYSRKHSVLELMCKSLRRQALFKNLVTVIDRNIAKQ